MIQLYTFKLPTNSINFTNPGKFDVVDSVDVVDAVVLAGTKSADDVAALFAVESPISSIE